MTGTIRIKAMMLAALLLMAGTGSAAESDVGACVSCPAWVDVPAGEFLMGSDDDEPGREEDEGPVHEVSIARPYRVAVHEITVAQFADFVSESGYELPAGCLYIDTEAGQWIFDEQFSWRDPGFEQADDHPVTCVNWDDARAYADWLGERSGLPVRLPSEAEWEYAVRAGTTTSRFWGDDEADGCEFSNAVDEGVKAHFPSWKFAPCVDGFHYTNPVGHFTSNPWGIHDMPGNLWEWTLDCWNDSHVGAPGDGSARETGACERRVIRGGAWDDEHEDLRSANRLAVPAERRYNTIGIRVVTE